MPDWLKACDLCNNLAMQAGFSLMETGLVRSKNATNILMKSTLDACECLFTFVSSFSPEDKFVLVFVLSLKSYRCHRLLAGWLCIRVR